MWLAAPFKVFISMPEKNWHSHWLMEKSFLLKGANIGSVMDWEPAVAEIVIGVGVENLVRIMKIKMTDKNVEYDIVIDKD